MANLSSFFPTAGGGGGFTKMNKYSTNRALDDATHKLPPTSFYGRQFSNLSVGATSITTFQLTTPSGYETLASEIVGGTFVHNGTTHTIATNTAYDQNTAGFNFTFTPALTATMAAFSYVTITNPTSLTVNPATDLGLSDGDSIGFFMVGAGDTTSSGTVGAMGGNIIQGTKIISSASTDLVITPGVGANTASTISGGLTITTANGNNRSGSAHYRSTTGMSAGNGINGYGQGALGTDLGGFAEQTNPKHGFGSGTAGSTASDGAILIFY